MLPPITLEGLLERGAESKSPYATSSSRGSFALCKKENKGALFLNSLGVSHVQLQPLECFRLPAFERRGGGAGKPTLL